MSNQHKLFATAATAALVASAVVPVASAAQLNDLDTVPSWAKDSVQFLAEQNIFNGDEKGNFNPSKTLTRAEAATVLMNAKGLKATGSEDFTDVSEKDWFYDAVLATSPELFDGVGAGKFAPKAELTRAQAAKVIVAAYGLTGKADLSNFTDASEIPAWAKADFETAVENGVIQGNGSKLSPNANISRAEFATMIKRTIDKVTDVEQEVELAVESISAVTTTEVEVKFNEAVEAFDRNDVVIEDENGDRVFVKSVELSEDGTSATVELYDALEDETSYDFSITAGEEELTYSYEFLLGEVSEILVSSVTIDPSENYEIEYTVLTDTGVDVTESTNVTFNDDRTDVDTSNGVISAGSLEDGESVFVEIVAGDVKSDRIKITANDGKASEFADYSVVASAVGDLDDWTAEDFEADKDIALGQSGLFLDALFLDQYGDQANGNVKFESLSPDVLVIDEETGALTPRKVGSADIKVTNGDITKVVTIKVVAAAEFTALEIRNSDDEAISELAINPNVDSTETVSVQLLDQYGDDFDPATEEDLTVEVNGDSVVVDQEGEVTTVGGKIDLDLTAVDDETGTTTITVKNADGTIVKTLKVSIEEAGEFADYQLEGLKEIDLYGDQDTKDNTVNSTNLKVFPVDNNGVKTGQNVAADWVIENKDGDVVDSINGESEVTLGESGDLTVSETGTYTLKVTVGDLEVVNTTFKVVDSESPYVLTQTEDELNVDNTTGNLFDAIKDSIEITQNGNAVDVNGITEFSVVSNKAAVVANAANSAFTLNADNGVDVVLADGVATIYVDEVVINGKTVEVDYQFEVTVEDLTAPTVSAMTYDLGLGLDPLAIDAGDTVSITFSEALSAASATAVIEALEANAVFGTDASVTTDDKTTFIVTTGENLTFTEATSITIDAADVVDAAGNVSADDVTFTVSQ